MEKLRAKTLRIGVLMGGFSSEREISLKSGNSVITALSSAGHAVVPIDVTAPSAEGADPTNIDVAFIALHGKFGEDGELQALMETRGIPYTGSRPQGSRNAMDKFLTKELFRKHGVATASYFTMSGEYSIERVKALVQYVGLPVVVKPRSEGSSVGVSVVKATEALDKAVEECKKLKSDILIERYIEGREITVGVLDGRPLPLIELVPEREFFDYEAKYKDSRTKYIVEPEFPAEVVAAAQEEAVKAFKALDLRHFARIDMIVAKENSSCQVLEANSIPGMTERSLLPKAAAKMGYDFPRLCEHLVELAIS